MRVRAKAVLGDSRPYAGYYNFVRRRPGDVFDLLDAKHFSSRWMERVEETVPKTKATGEPLLDDLLKDQPGLAGKVKGGKATGDKEVI